MRMVIGGRIAMFDIPSALRTALVSELSLHNPAYAMAKRRNPNARIFMTPTVPYYEDRNGIMYVGRGMEEYVKEWCEKNDEELEWSDRTALPHYPSQSMITLRPYQDGVPEKCLEEEHGIVKMATGAGKTIVALRMAELLRTTALFIVPKKSIMGQFASDIEKLFGEKPGIIGDGQFDVRPFTVATMQTLQKRIPGMPKDFAAKLSSCFGAVFVDECHTAVPKKSRKVVEFFASRYLYGLTATNRRTDEQGKALDFMFGKVLCDVRVDRAVPSVDIVPYAEKIAMGEYHDIIETQTNDYARNQAIAARAKEEIGRGRKALILCKRVEHAAVLAESIGTGVRVIALRSEDPAKETAATVAAIRDGSLPFDCIVGTFSLLSAGTDFPSLDTLVLAGDLKSDVLAEQACGRILRLFEGKADPLVIDFADHGNYILKRQAKEREKFYVSQGWKINKTSI